MLRNTAIRILSLGIACIPLFSQTAQISGRVTDTSQSVVVSAKVFIVNVETGVRREVATDGDGYFTAPLLARGIYRIEVQQPGFKIAVRDGLTLDEGASIRADFAMEVGAVSESIEVSGAAPLLETERPTISSVIANQRILDLPTQGRNPLQFALLVPGVRATGRFGDLPVSAFDGSRASIGGGNPSGNNYMVDGIAAENFTSGGLQTPLSVDATEEFRIVVRNPSAEYGRSGGGIINLISKSGSNQFRGSLYEFHRNEDLAANDFFSNSQARARNPLVFNQFGATLGGPIRKDKTFFFANWEKFAQRTLDRTFRSVPTDPQRQGDFSQTLDGRGQPVRIYDPLTTRPDPANPARRIRDAFAGNRIPAARFSPVAVEALAFYPAANAAGVQFTAANNFYGTGSTPLDKDIYSGKIDHYLASTRRVAGRFTWDRTFRGQPNYYSNIADPLNSDIVFKRLSTMLNYSDSIRPSVFVDVRAGLNRYAAIRNDQSLGFDLTKLKLPGRLNGQLQVPVFPQITVADLDGLGGPPGDQLVQANYAYSYTGSVTWIAGRHSWRFGTDNRIYQLNNSQIPGAVLNFGFTRAFTQGPDPNVASTTAGHGLAAFLLGTPASGQAGRYAVSTYTAKNYALFVQDDWKLTPKVTLNLGLRWEREGGVTDRYNALSNFDPHVLYDVSGIRLRGGLAFPGTGGLDRGHRDAEWTNFQPRAGFAWQVRRGTVVRGGYGISFLPTTGIVVAYSRTGFNITTPMVTSVDGGFTPSETWANPFPGGILLPTGSADGVKTALGLAAEGNVRSLKRGYSQQWNLNIQKELPGEMLVEVGYMGNRGIGLPASRTFDYLPTALLARGTALQQLVDNPLARVILSGPLSQPRVTWAALNDHYPQFNGASGLDSWANSIYHAATLRVEKRFARGLSSTLSYTFSKLLDNNLGNGGNAFFDSGANNVQDWDNLRAERAPSTSDLPQRLVLSASYELPFGKSGTAWVRRLAGGWQLNAILQAQSGDVLPVTAPAPAFGGGRPNVVGDPNAVERTLNRWINRDAFATIAPFTFGNAPRNLPRTRTDGLFQMDLSVLKSFPVHERARLEFRAEAFNISNTPTFGPPGTNIAAGSFGVVSSLATNSTPRVIQLAVKLYY